MTRLMQPDLNSPNAAIGIILLIVLGVFAVPNLLPKFVSGLSPHLFAGMPCSRLRSAKDLAAHQSIIGRAVQDPLTLEVTVTDIDADGTVLIRLTVTNSSLGTVPIVYQEDNVAVSADDDQTHGFGIIIDPAPSAGLRPRRDANPIAYHEADIRMLGPRQKCAHSLSVTASPQLISDGGGVRAYYRMAVSGAHPPSSPAARLIYADQGLDILTEDALFSAPAKIKPRP